ncbi:MAG: glycosyltransferase [bacterium]
MDSKTGMHLGADAPRGEAASDVALRIPANRAHLPLIVLVMEHLRRGGVQQELALHAATYDRKRYRLAVVSLKQGDDVLAQVQNCGVPVHFIAVHHPRDWDGLRTLAHWFVKNRPAIIHTFSYFANQVGRLAAAMAGVPVVVSYYVSLYSRHWDRRGLRLERLLAPRTTAFVMNSEAVLQDFLRATRLKPPLTRVIHNGVDPTLFDEPLDPLAIRHSLGADSDNIVICAVARLVELKNIETLIEAAARVVTRVPAARFWLMGDGEERERLEQLAVEKRLGERFLFVGMTDQVPRYLRAADILVSTSLVEGFPLNILEGMAAGLAVVATPAGGTAEAISDRQDGRIFPFRDMGALSKILVELCESPETRRRLGQAARRTVAERFTAERWQRDTEALYAEILQKKDPQLQAWRALSYFKAAQRVRLRAKYWPWRVRLFYWGI